MQLIQLMHRREAFSCLIYYSRQLFLQSKDKNWTKSCRKINACTEMSFDRWKSSWPDDSLRNCNMEKKPQKCTFSPTPEKLKCVTVNGTPFTGTHTHAFIFLFVCCIHSAQFLCSKFSLSLSLHSTIQRCRPCSDTHAWHNKSNTCTHVSIKINE